jgi:hypothetical protein
MNEKKPVAAPSVSLHTLSEQIERVNHAKREAAFAREELQESTKNLKRFLIEAGMTDMLLVNNARLGQFLRRNK